MLWSFFAPITLPRCKRFGLGSTLRIMSSERPVEVTTGPVDPNWLASMYPWLQGEDPPALTILPDRMLGEKAVFSADIAPLAKHIRSQGFDAQLLRTPAQTFRSEYGADSAIELSILLNVAGSAAWDSFKYLLHVVKIRVGGAKETGAEPLLSLTQGIHRYPDGPSYLWQTFSGPATDVIDLAESTVREYMSGTLASDQQVIESNEGSDDRPWIAPE